MHDAVKVIGLPERVDLPRFHLEEVILLAWGTKTQVYALICTHSQRNLHVSGGKNPVYRQTDTQEPFKMLKFNSGMWGHMF